jgi:sec-independent protein translocase protein TatA
MFGLGATELIIILVIVLIIFGAGKLPQIGDALGRSIKNFKKAADTGSELDVTPKKELGDPGQVSSTEKVADKAKA